MDEQELKRQVDAIVRQIGAREKLGTERDVAIIDQTFSKLTGIESDTVNAVIDYIERTKVWDLTYVAAFKAVLKSTLLHQPSSDKQTMQIENALTQKDWDRL